MAQTEFGRTEATLSGMDAATVGWDQAREARSAIPVGTVLNGRYRVLGSVGAGGFGEVYECYDESTGQRFAIKSPHRAVQGTRIRVAGSRAETEPRTEDRDALIRGLASAEYKALSATRHPNVVQVFDRFVTEDGRPCLVMEFLRGGSLGRHLKDRAVTFHEGAKLLGQACEGIHACHQAGFLHRDPKPDNMIVSDAGELKVIDFGIAISRPDWRPEPTQKRGFAGTPLYASPEATTGEIRLLSPRSDVYSLGVMGYQMFTGSLPVPPELETHPMSVLEDKARITPLPAVRLNPRIPRRLAKALDKALSIDPDDRFESAQDFGAAVGEGVRGVTARVPSKKLESGEQRTMLTQSNAPPSIVRQLAGHVGAPEPAPGREWFVRVYYATDRAPTTLNFLRGREFYGHQRSEAGLRYGVCRVSIPRNHTIGRLETCRFWRLEFKPDPSKHVVLEEARELSADAFFKRLEFAADTADKSLFVFVHGFNVKFRDAVLRTAQLAHDLDFAGPPILYSWPSRGRPDPRAYLRDETNVQWSYTHFHSFLVQLCARLAPRAIHVIAHSMGNRAIAHSLGLLSYIQQAPEGAIDQAVFAAPDIDADTFSEACPLIRKGVRQVTMYASARDRALLASKLVHGYRRAGDSRPAPVLIDGVHTIDASGVDFSILGLNHSYVAASEMAIKDLAKILKGRLHPDARGLRQLGSSPRVYWTLEEKGEAHGPERTVQ